MKQVTKSAVLAALDCAWCRALATEHGDDPMDVLDPGIVDFGTGPAYALKERDTCPDCGRTFHVIEGRNFYVTRVKLDREPV